MSDPKTILVHVDEAAHCPQRLAVAEALARRFAAELIAAYVAPPLMLPIFMPHEIVDPGVIEIWERQRQADRAKAETHFAALKQRMPAAVWRALDGEIEGPTVDIVRALATAARQADLVVVGQTVPDEGDRSRPGLVPEHLVLQTGRPVLVVPYAGHFASIGERVLVAWNNSRESARALHDALPLLRHAKAVTLVQLAEPEVATEAGSQLEAELQGVVRLLERHGVKATAALMPGAKAAQAAELLLSRAADLDADLLVMGAYGHSRFRELVLGGATREILSSMTLPVLFAH